MGVTDQVERQRVGELAVVDTQVDHESFIESQEAIADDVPEVGRPSMPAVHAASHRLPSSSSAAIS
jgi:hypothetical protein